ncbi:capping protein, Arp2/3 and myosin-I linker protein 3 [Bombina bombina]|uniref:capping protein, Arp2/3 and myosin-I linker protein 3 n=1 Tax=Bombina bombina TaxID=8345 RepID=UPI00235AE85D|nr:capping protein, Arp2/3 and myosin-I linker protein 3 [Bombina bombina]
MNQLCAEPCRALQDSIRQLLSRAGGEFRLQKVQLETRPRKLEDRILVTTCWRFYIFLTKLPAKIESSFSVLEIRSLTAISISQLLIETEKGSFQLTLTTQNTDQLINCIQATLSKIFPTPDTVCLIRRQYPESANSSQNPSPSSDTAGGAPGSGICGGFSETYAALCDYNNVCCREEVQWDVDMIYHSQDNREFNLQDFSHLESRDLALVVAALAYNQYFLRLQAANLKLGSEVTEQILHCVGRSQHLEELILEDCGLRPDFALRLSSVLTDNSASTLHTLNLSHNPLEDRGITALSQQFLYFHGGLRSLNLSKTNITGRGALALCQSLCQNALFSSSLHSLTLSKNPGLLGSEEINALYTFLSHPNSLVYLDLSGTDCAVDTIFGALALGCCSCLSHLDLSKNSLSHRRTPETLPSVEKFFGSSLSLSHVSLSGTKVPPELLRALLQGLCSNTHIQDLQLDLSSCELRSVGSQILQEQFPPISSIGSLNISDNGLDSNLMSLVPALARNRHLKHLSLGKNFSVKSRVLEEILQRIVNVLQDEDCSLQSLSLADSRLKSRTCIVLNALGSNTSLHELDISGNGMSDMGAKMLGKTLQINTTLKSVLWDKNAVTATGFMDVARALEKNRSLRFMSFPVGDICQAYQKHPERTENAWRKIHSCLLRNSQTVTVSDQRALRLQQGVTSSAEQMLQTLSAMIQDHIYALRSCDLDTVQEDILCARQLLRDARNCRALLPRLLEAGSWLSPSGPAQRLLETVSFELSRAVNRELQNIADSMWEATQDLFPGAARDAQRGGAMLCRLREQHGLSPPHIQDMLRQIGVEIHSKLRAAQLSLMTRLSNSVLEQVLQEMQRTHRKLSRHRTQLQTLMEEEQRIMGYLPHTPPRKQDSHEGEMYSNIDTMVIKRRLQGRKIRPVSAFISVSEQELSPRTLDLGSPGSRDLSSPPPLSSSASSQLSRSLSVSLEGLSDLPTEGGKLQHQTRDRPKQQSRRAPGGGRVRGPASDSECPDTALDEGLEDFFHRTVMTQSQSVSQGPSGDPAAPPKRRRRSLFHFRRSRTPKRDRGRPAPPPSPGPEGGKDHLKLEGLPITNGNTNSNGTEDDYMAVVRGLPGRGTPSFEQIQDEVQPSRVRGVPLPGMEGVRLWREVDTPGGTGCVSDDRRRSSGDGEEGATFEDRQPCLSNGDRNNQKNLSREEGGVTVSCPPPAELRPVAAPRVRKVSCGGGLGDNECLEEARKEIPVPRPRNREPERETAPPGGDSAPPVRRPPLKPQRSRRMQSCDSEQPPQVTSPGVASTDQKMPPTNDALRRGLRHVAEAKDREAKSLPTSA